MFDGLGVSAGDDYYPTPYAYVGPWTQRTGPFWNAPFGALYPLDPAPDVDSLTSHNADFFQRSRKERQKGIVMAEFNSDFSQYRRPLSGYRERDDRNSRRNSADRRAA